MAIYDSFCERYGLSLCELQSKYSMAQLALLSHVAAMKQKDLERDMPKTDEQPAGRGSSAGRKGKRLNTDNAEAYMLIASGILG